MLSIIDYKEPMGRGVGEPWNIDIDWHYPKRGSITWKILDTACGIEWLKTHDTS